MLKQYRYWLSAAVVLLLLNAVVHSISLFIPFGGDNEKELQLVEMVTTYKLDMGAGFHPTFSNLFTALSSCFSFVCLLSGLTLLYLMRKRIDPNVLRGVIGINLIVFAGIFIVMAFLTFLPPVILTGLISINLLIAFVLIPKAGEPD